MTRRLIAATVVAALLAGGACTKADKKSAAPKPSAKVASGAPRIALASDADGLKIGLIVSSAGPGADVKDLAAGAYVAAFRLNGAPKEGIESRPKVALVVEDDNGTAEGASAAMQAMADQGVAGVVYASLGDHITSGVAKASELGMPVVLPYADDPAVVDAGKTSVLTAPTIPQVAVEFASHLRDNDREKVALVRQAGSYGDAGKAALSAAAVDFVSDSPYSPGSVFDAKGVVAAKPDAVVVWAEAAPAVAVADGLSAAGFGGELLFADRAAVPTFGKLVVGSLAPSVGDGVLSAGSWAGADTPGAAVDAFYLARDKAVSDGGVSADLAVADFRSHDAVLALVEGAGSNTDRGNTLDGLRALGSDAITGAAGTPVDYSSARALSDDDVALLSYSTLDVGDGRYPAVANAGGHWLAVDGTFDNPYGGN